MEIITIRTLVDITKPNVQRAGQGSVLEQSQYKNWITLQQCIGLRSVITYDNPPTAETVDIKGLGFGSKHKGKQQVWTFEFYPDRQHAYEDEQGRTIGLLRADFHQVPVIENLTETINISKAVFDVEDPEYKNIIIMASLRQLQAD
jgi:hypothetical protein